MQQVLVELIGVILVLSLLGFIVVVGHHVGVSTAPAIGPDDPEAREGSTRSAH